jgi:hypothetical protein
LAAVAADRPDERQTRRWDGLGGNRVSTAKAAKLRADEPTITVV